MDEIILASGSPRRRELLEKAGVKFTVFTAPTEEDTALTDPQEVVKELSCRKAAAVWELCRKDLPLAVIGADTIVALEGEILGKPKDEEDALRMLKELSGRTHQVYTGVTLIYRPRGVSAGAESNEIKSNAVRENKESNPAGENHKINEKNGEESPSYDTLTFVEGTDVTFYPVSEEILRKYIATGEPMDKAGAYGIQGLFGLFTSGIRGDIDNVIGLPVPRLLQEASRAGIRLSPWQGGLQ